MRHESDEENLIGADAVQLSTTARKRLKKMAANIFCRCFHGLIKCGEVSKVTIELLPPLPFFRNAYRASSVILALIILKTLLITMLMSDFKGNHGDFDQESKVWITKCR